MNRELGPAGFWRRAAALAVDWLWLFSLSGSLAWLLFGAALPFGAGGMPRLGAGLIHDLLPAVVFIIGWTRYGTTPGKLLLDLRVVDAATGGRPSLMQALLRYLGYIVAALPLGLGFVWAAFDRRKQGLHDKLARTRVVVIDEAILAEPGGAAA